MGSDPFLGLKMGQREVFEWEWKVMVVEVVAEDVQREVVEGEVERGEVERVLWVWTVYKVRWAR